MAVALHVGAQSLQRFRLRLHVGGDHRDARRIELAEIALVDLAEFPDHRLLVSEQRLDELLQGARRLLGERTPGVEHDLARCGLAKNGDDEEPRETVRPVGIGEQAGREESVVAALRAIGVEHGKHSGIVVDDPVDLDAQQLDIRLRHGPRDQPAVAQPGKNVVGGITVLPIPCWPGSPRPCSAPRWHRPAPVNAMKKPEANVCGLHAQRFVAERLKMRVPLGHVRPSRGSRWTSS